MRTVTVERTIDAPPSTVWAVLADYPNIDRWNEGVLKSYAVGDAAVGLGAQRKCELTPKGRTRMRETVTDWVPEQRMVVELDQMEKLPLREAAMTFTLGDRGQATEFAMRYEFVPKGGPLSGLLGRLMAPHMRKGFNGFIDDLESEARAEATT